MDIHDILNNRKDELIKLQTQLSEKMQQLAKVEAELQLIEDMLNISHPADNLSMPDKESVDVSDLIAQKNAWEQQFGRK